MTLTQKKFKEYEKEICEKMGFGFGVWELYQIDIIQFFGEYNPKVKYAGRGDSRKWTLTGWLVPEPFDNFIFYVHDGFYKLIKDYELVYECFKPRADEIMEEMMKIKANRPSLLPDLYYRFVRWFG